MKQFVSNLMTFFFKLQFLSKTIKYSFCFAITIKNYLDSYLCNILKKQSLEIGRNDKVVKYSEAIL